MSKRRRSETVKAGKKPAAPAAVERPVRRLLGIPWTALPLLTLLLTVVGLLTIGFLWNEDLWWYLATGRDILTHGRLLQADPFVIDPGKGSTAPIASWLWCVIVAACYHLGGYLAVALFGMLVAGAVVVLVYRRGFVDRLGLLNSALVVLVLVAAAERLSHKAELATWLLSVVFVLLLDRRERSGARTWITLLVLEWLWSNLHAGFILGCAIVGAYSVGSIWHGWRRQRLGLGTAIRKADPPLWLPPALLAVTLASPAALHRLGVITAFGSIFARRASGQHLWVRIAEMQGTFDVGDRRWAWILFLAAAVALASFLANRHDRRNMGRLLLLGGFVVLGIIATRLVTGLAAIAGLVTLTNLTAGREDGRPPAPLGGLQVAGAALLAGYLAFASWGLWLVHRDLRADQASGVPTLSPLAACPEAIDYIEAHHLRGPIFNDMLLGGYTLFRLYPPEKVFVDNRLLIRPLVDRYVEASMKADAWAKAEATYGFHIALLGPLSTPSPLAIRNLLTRDPSWHLVFLDAQAAVFYRGASQPPPEIHLTGTATGGAVPFLVPESGLAVEARAASHWFFRDSPNRLLHQYLSLLGELERFDDLDRLAGRALQVRPTDATLFRLRGAARMSLGRRAEGLADLRKAVDLDPGEGFNHLMYARALADAGHLREALDEIAAARRLEPGNPQIDQTEREIMARSRRF